MSLFIEIKFVGGLGNQLFQYATSRSLGIKNKIPYILLNTEGYKKNNPRAREFGLKYYKINGHIINSEIVNKMLRPGTKMNKFISIFPGYNAINENGLKLQMLSYRKSLLTSLSGYWQSEYYFNDIRSILIEELVPKILPPFPNWLLNNNTVAVHVRRTDYLLESQFGFLGKKYYVDSIDFFAKKIDNPLFIFFSDDIEWCKEEFKNDNSIFFDDNMWKADYLQLFLMSKCLHQIIANSSFSWWGAWLNTNPEKIIIRPETPFRDKSIYYESYYPNEWLSICN